MPVGLLCQASRSRSIEPSPAPWSPIHLGCGWAQSEIAVDGTFRIEGLCPGPWLCYAGSKDWGRRPGWGGGMLSSSDSSPLANSRPVLVTTSREDLELVLRSAGSLSGRFVGSNISPHFGVAINGDTEHRYALRFDHEGFSAVGLDPGTYMVVGTNAEGWGVLEGTQVEEGSALTDVEVTIEPAAYLRVSLPSERERLSVFMNGVLLPDVRTTNGLLVTHEVPAGRLEVHLRGSSQVRTVEAIAGHTVSLTF